MIGMLTHRLLQTLGYILEAKVSGRARSGGRVGLRRRGSRGRGGGERCRVERLGRVSEYSRGRREGARRALSKRAS